MLKSLLLFMERAEELPNLHELVRMAAAKAKRLENTKAFINIKTYHYFPEHRVYVVLYEVGNGVLSESSVLEEPSKH